MDVKDFTKLIESKQSEINAFVRQKMPVIAGRMAKDHFQNNFRKGGFVDRGLNKWQPSKRLSSDGNSAASQYGTLLSSRNRLFGSINYTCGSGWVKVSTGVKYAAIHNQGGTKTSTVTPRMRKFAWRQFYKEAGIRKNASGKTRKKRLAALQPGSAAMFWRNLALTKKTKITQRLPKRQFIGESETLSGNISAKLEAEIRKILNI